MDFDPEYWGATTEEVLTWFNNAEELFTYADEVYDTTLESCEVWWKENGENND